MSCIFTNGKKWHELHSCLVSLCLKVNEAADALGKTWEPARRRDASWEDAWEEWQAIEALHIDDIHKTARELAHTGKLSNPAPEILYYLRLRIVAAFRHAGDAYYWKDGRQASMIPFPAVPLSEFIEWLLIERIDTHSVELAYPEEACL